MSHCDQEERDIQAEIIAGAGDYIPPNAKKRATIEDAWFAARELFKK